MKNQPEEYQEPEEGDYVIQPSGDVAQYGKIVIRSKDYEHEAEAVEKAIIVKMGKDKYWPNVWTLSDHGNLNLLAWDAKAKEFRQANPLSRKEAARELNQARFAGVIADAKLKRGDYVGAAHYYGRGIGAASVVKETGRFIETKRAGLKVLTRLGQRHYEGRPIGGLSNPAGFSKWLDALISEKGIDPEETFEFETPNAGFNVMPYGVVIEAAKRAPAHEQAAIKDMLVKIDFKAGDVRHYLRHLGKALSLNLGNPKAKFRAGDLWPCPKCKARVMVIRTYTLEGKPLPPAPIYHQCLPEKMTARRGYTGTGARCLECGGSGKSALIQKIKNSPREEQGMVQIGRKCLKISTSTGNCSGNMGAVYGLKGGHVFIKGFFPKLPTGSVCAVEYLDEAKATREGFKNPALPWRHDFSKEAPKLRRVKGGLLMVAGKKPLWGVR